MVSILRKPLSTLIPNLLGARNRLYIKKMSQQPPNFETLAVSNPKEFVFNVELNRPNQLNAVNETLWLELGKCFNYLATNPDCRVIVLSGAGKIFTAGLDFNELIQFAQRLAAQDDLARKGKILEAFIKSFQESITSMEICRKPVLAAVHAACVGAGVDIITAADMRYCTKNAWFQVKEVDIGMAADVGTLQRLPKVIGSDSVVRELCYTARKLPAAEALSIGLVSRVFEDKDSMMKGVLEIAEDISKKSPVAVQGTKFSLVYGRDHTVQEGLDHIAIWNQLMLQTEDFANAALAQATNQADVKFAKL